MSEQGARRMPVAARRARRSRRRQFMRTTRPQDHRAAKTSAQPSRTTGSRFSKLVRGAFRAWWPGAVRRDEKSSPRWSSRCRARGCCRCPAAVPANGWARRDARAGWWSICRRNHGGLGRRSRSRAFAFTEGW